jgi:hypothetical protein
MTSIGSQVVSNDSSAEPKPTSVTLQVQGGSVNPLTSDLLTKEIERVRSDEAFTNRAKRLLDRDTELLERLAH